MVTFSGVPQRNAKDAEQFGQCYARNVCHVANVE